MEEQKLKTNTIRGLIWSTIDRFSGQTIHFVLGILLARLLAPSDFGVIGMLTIFMAISEAIIDSGFGNALIQKKNRNQDDYSTVFIINSILGCILYFVMYLAAPWIADFYSMPILKSVTRIVALNLLFNSLMIVHNTKLTIELNFKLQTKIRFSSNVFAGIIALFLAYSGLGVWALVFQTVLTQFLICVSLWCVTKWKPTLCFSMNSFRTLFSFGSKLLLTGLYGPIFNNLNTLIIGKFYSASALGFYTRSFQFVQFPSYNISQIISRVSYPVLSSIQDDDVRLESAYRKLIRDTYFVVFPLMFGLTVISKPLIILTLSEKWTECVAYMQILCFSLLLYPICSYNINLLLVKGKSGLHLKLDLLKKVVSIIILSITAFIGIEAICYGMVISSLFSWIVTAIPSGRLVNLTLKRQILDLLPSFICSIIMAFLISPIANFGMNDLSLILLQISCGALLYVIISYFFNKECMFEIIRTITK